MTTEAVAYRERLMAEAAAERSKMLDEARDEAQERVRAVERELADAHQSERSSLINQITELEGTHKLLQDDVSRFEQYLKQRAAQVRSALEDVTAILDDPEGLRAQDGIEPADIDDLEADAYPPIAVEVVALNDLESEADLAAEAIARPTNVVDAAELEELAPDPAQPADDADEPEDEFFGDDDDPEMGVTTQVIAPPPLDEASIDPQEETLPPPARGAEAPAAGSFADDLRRATNEEHPINDPIGSFLEDDKQDRGTGGWFGRRR